MSSTYKRHRNLSDALRLGHQLLGQHGRWHDVEDVNGIEADRAVPTQASDWQRATGRLEAGLPWAVLKRGEQGVAIGEAAVQRGARHARGRRDVGERGGGRPLQHPLRRVEDALPVAQRVRASEVGLLGGGHVFAALLTTTSPWCASENRSSREKPSHLRQISPAHGLAGDITGTSENSMKLVRKRRRTWSRA